MSDRPKLSICVPSRNRQHCFRQTILDLTASPRPDVEFVFADNSDDPAIMDRFVAGLNDPRIHYIPSAPETLSMRDNWERTVAAANGEWVTVIGDDDYLEPDLVDYIIAIEARDGEVDAIAWNRATFQWPDARVEPKSIPISLKNQIQRHTQEQMRSALFGWNGATFLPQCPYGIYHGAIPRRSLTRIIQRYSGRYFDHPVVDYDFSHKLLASSERLVYINRPMSVLGVARSSNSAAVGNSDRTKKALDNWRGENGTSFDETVLAAGFPFRPETGVAGSIMATQYWFKLRHEFEYAGWEENFARAVTAECSLWRDLDEFEDHTATCRRAFETWDGGRYLPLFQPRFEGYSRHFPFCGLRTGSLYVGQEIGDAGNPAAFYSILKAMLPRPQEIEYRL